MELTTTDLQTLKRPFAATDHEFIRGFVYLTEEAICNRLEEVDSGWQFEIMHLSNSGDNAIAHARMTINGVSREGVGMQKINEKAGEAEKGAATDALKRCARLFGVGRYLLGAPEQGKFNQWLSGLMRQSPTSPVLDAARAAGGTVSKRDKADEPTLPGGDLRDKEIAGKFIQRWRNQSLTDAEVLAALGVSKLSAWDKGRDKADEAVDAWLLDRINEPVAS